MRVKIPRNESISVFLRDKFSELNSVLVFQSLINCLCLFYYLFSEVGYFWKSIEKVTSTSQFRFIEHILQIYAALFEDVFVFF